MTNRKVCENRIILLLHSRNTPNIKQWSALPQDRSLEKFIQTNGPKNKGGVAILISNKMDFKPKLMRIDKERHYIIIKGKIHLDNNLVLNICVSSKKSPKPMKETLLWFKQYIDPPLTDIKQYIDPHSLILNNILTLTH